jgi:hypothetical protein
MPHPDEETNGNILNLELPTLDEGGFDLDQAIQELLDEQEAALTRRTASSSTTTTTSTSTSKTTGKRTTSTEQISRRFFDVPTTEEFLNDFETAFGGFLGNMRASGLGSGDINLALDPATGLMDLLLSDYMGNIAQRAAAGEDIFELVGTEEDFKLIREEPGTESVTRGEDVSVTEGETTSESRTGGTTTAEGEEGPVSTSTSTSTSRGKQRSESRQTSESRFEETVQVLSRPKIAAVFKFSPTEFLAERFKDDPGALSTFIQAQKGTRTRQRQTLTGGPVVSARRA